MIRLKSIRDIKAIWRSGQIAGRLHLELKERIIAGVTTRELDQFAQDFIAKHNAQPSFLGYRNFPAALCISINEEIVHGIPGDREVEQGDLVSIDLGVTLDGYISDTAQTWLVDSAGPARDATAGNSDIGRLCQGTRDSLFAGIAAVVEGRRLRDVNKAVHQVLLNNRLGIIRDLTGHGVGFALHEEPTVYNFDTGVSGPILRNGLVLAIEPMATLGSEEILLGADNWTYLTMDGSLAAHYEHTVALWDGEVFNLTDPDDERAREMFGS